MIFDTDKGLRILIDVNAWYCYGNFNVSHDN